jgi:hypothetical protein
MIQVRRISWVRGVGRPALAHSGLLVPLPNADRPPFSKCITTLQQALDILDFFEALKTKTPPIGAAFWL